MTVSDMPLADAMGQKAVEGPLRGWASTRACARLAAIAGYSKWSAAVAVVGSTVVRDARRWWLVATRPVSLRAWLRASRPSAVRVPDDSRVLRGLWLADTWTLGTAVLVVSVGLYLAAGGLRWLAGHPLRRWPTLLAAAALVVWWSA